VRIARIPYLERNMRPRLVIGILVAFAGGMAFTANADEPKKPAANVNAANAPSYSKAVAPLLKDACANCHSGVKRKAGLDVTSYDSLMKFVKAGDPAASKLHKSVTGKGAKPMPPKNPLADDQVQLIRDWIAAGAKKD
jgi:hypothetical protein